MGINVKLEAFEGPMDLLLHLIDKNKVDIMDIPIAIITEQYMAYVASMDKEDLNLVSEFLVMASTLLDIKSRMLLPKEVDENGQEIDPRDDLVQRLLEFKMCKYMAQELKDRAIDADKSMFREANIPKEVEAYRPPVDVEGLFDGMTLAKLNAIFTDVMRKQEDRKDPIRSQFGRITKEEVSMSDKFVDMKEYLKTHDKFSFREALEKNRDKLSVIVTFLVVLELMKTGFLRAEQESPESDIIFTRLRDAEELNDFDEGVLDEA